MKFNLILILKLDGIKARILEPERNFKAHLDDLVRTMRVSVPTLPGRMVKLPNRSVCFCPDDNVIQAQQQPE